MSRPVPPPGMVYADSMEALVKALADCRAARADTSRAALSDPPVTPPPPFHKPECGVNHPEPEADWVRCDCGAIRPGQWNPETKQWEQ